MELPNRVEPFSSLKSWVIVTVDSVSTLSLTVDPLAIIEPSARVLFKAELPFSVMSDERVTVPLVVVSTLSVSPARITAFSELIMSSVNTVPAARTLPEPITDPLARSASLVIVCSAPPILMFPPIVVPDAIVEPISIVEPAVMF